MSRHPFPTAAILAGLLIWSLPTPVLAQAQPFSAWFKYGSDIEKVWNVVGSAEKPMEVTLKPKAAQKGALKRVLVLYPRPSSAYDVAITEMLKVFTAKDLNTEVVAINFELDDKRGMATLRNAEANKFDLVIAMGSESAAWLYKNYLNGALPVVTVCSKDPVQLGQVKDYETGSKSNFAYTSLNVPVEVQMAYVRELKPNLKNIAILVDAKNVSAVQTQAEPIAAYARAKGIQVIAGTVKDPAKARQELETLIPEAVRKMRETDPDLSNSLFWVTGSTSVFKEIQTINQYADRVPVVSVVPEIVTAGADTAVLGIGISFESNAQLAGTYGAKVLNGAKAGELKVGLVSPPDVAISFLKAKEIGLRVPFGFFEIASFVYDYSGKAVRTVARSLD